MVEVKVPYELEPQGMELLVIQVQFRNHKKEQNSIFTPLYQYGPNPKP